MRYPSLIRTVNLVHIHDNKLLLVRVRGKSAFYMPGGKPESGEDALTALCREILEELGTEVVVDSLRPYSTFEDQAYGFPETTRVRVDCYFGALHARPSAQAEIAEIRYFGHDEYLAMPKTAPAVRRVVGDLHANSLIA